jgi:hypothetical protein
MKLAVTGSSENRSVVISVVICFSFASHDIVLST